MTDNKSGAFPRDMPLNILLVDDNEADVKIAVRAFQQAQRKTNLYVAGNGQECLDRVRHEGPFQDRAQYPVPQVILLDISMPVIDGFVVLTALKNDEHTRTIPVVMLSASNNEQDVLKSYALGASSFIQKPVAYEDFVKVIEGFNYYWHVVSRLPRHKG